MSKDSRTEFVSVTDAELAEQLADLAGRRDDLKQRINQKCPTREDVEQKIATAQERMRDHLDREASGALNAALTVNSGARGFRVAQRAAAFYVLASDDYGQVLRDRLAAKRPTEADVTPLREALAEVEERHRALMVEQQLRAVDRQSEAAREAVMNRHTSERV